MKTVALSALLFLQLFAKGQSVSASVLNSAGNNYSQGNYSLEWSVGELAIVEPMKSIDGLVIISNGFLQPGIPSTNPISQFSGDELKILPNPTYNKIEINLSTSQLGVLTMLVYDTKGKLVKTAKCASYGVPIVEKIDLTGVASGTYFLKIDLTPSIGFIQKTGSYKIVKL